MCVFVCVCVRAHMCVCVCVYICEDIQGSFVEEKGSFVKKCIICYLNAPASAFFVAYDRLFFQELQLFCGK